MQSLKCVIVGDKNVGKTCMMLSYYTDYFPVDYVPTVTDNLTANILINEEPIKLNLWDTASIGDYDNLRYHCK